jgi:acetaldehyde dehydrogenase/alcohol dehydrogenase
LVAEKPSLSIGWLRVPPKIYFKAGCLEVAMAEFSKKKRVFIVTDKPLYDLGVSRKVTALLDSMRIQHKTYYHVESDPDLGMILDGMSFCIKKCPELQACLIRVAQD